MVVVVVGGGDSCVGEPVFMKTRHQSVYLTGVEVPARKVINPSFLVCPPLFTKPF